MTYIVQFLPYGPYFKSTDIVDFKIKVPDVRRRVEISEIWSGGRVRSRPEEGLLDPDEIPRTLRMLRHETSLRDIFQSTGRVNIISRELRDLLEELDSGIHQIVPIELEGLPKFGERFILNVHNFQDSIIDERSSVRQAGSDDKIMTINFLPAGGVDVCLDAARLSGVHLWREHRYPNSLLVSNLLHDEMKRRKIRFFKLWKATDV